MLLETIIAQVRDQTDLVALVGQSVDLKKRGGDFWGLCPFHSEKTPSFKVSESHRAYHCFGCGAKGSAIDWCMEHDGMKFTDAVKHLASILHLPIEDSPSTLPMKRFKKLAPKTTMPAEDSKVSFVKKDKACATLLNEPFGSTGHELSEWLGKKGINATIPRRLAQQHVMGLWGGKLVYFYPNAAVKIRDDLATSRSHRWDTGRANYCWLSDTIPPTQPLVYMTEGETDAMRVMSLVEGASVIAMPSASWTPTANDAYRIGAFRQVILCFDGDTAGRDATKRIAAVFWKHANSCRVFDIQMPDGMDCCKVDDVRLKSLIDGRTLV